MTFGAHTHTYINTHTHTQTHTHKGLVPMATGALCPRRPQVRRGKTERGGRGRGGLGELRLQEEVRVHTRTHRFLVSILQDVIIVCVCVLVCVCRWVCICIGKSGMCVLRRFCSPAKRSSSTCSLIFLLVPVGHLLLSFGTLRGSRIRMGPPLGRC